MEDCQFQAPAARPLDGGDIDKIPQVVWGPTGGSYALRPFAQQRSPSRLKAKPKARCAVIAFCSQCTIMYRSFQMCSLYMSVWSSVTLAGPSGVRHAEGMTTPLIENSILPAFSATFIELQLLWPRCCHALLTPEMT